MSSPSFPASALPFRFVPQSDNFISWTVARGSDGTTPVTDATGTATLYDEYGQAVPGGSCSLSTSGSGGIYTGTFARASFNPQPGRNYRLKINLVSSALSAGRTWWMDAWVIEENQP